MEDGYLKVRGRLGRVEWADLLYGGERTVDICGSISNDVSEISTMTGTVSEYDIFGDDRDTISVWLDTADYDWRTGYFLPLQLKEDNEEDGVGSSVEGLILMNEEDGSFVRVGKMSVWRNDAKDIIESFIELELTIK